MVKRDRFDEIVVSNHSDKFQMKCECSGCLVESVFLKLK